MKPLAIQGVQNEDGISVVLEDSTHSIKYPHDIWAGTSSQLKSILLDNITFASTLYVPSILKQQSVRYSTARPLSECFLLRNGIYDTSYCANVDGKSSVDYVKDFFNIQRYFSDETVKTPQNVSFTQTDKGKKHALILFSFGKESLLSYALCKELGLDTTLVSVIQPGLAHEWQNKKPLIEAFEKEFGEKVYTIDYQPGIFKEGKLWNKPTELGWGLHVTEYAMLSLPFAEVFGADYIVCGNEQSCHDMYYDAEGVLVYRAGLDQHREWTSQQSLLQSLMLGRTLPAISLVEPLYEIAETKILHTRYPEIAKYQMSCLASKDSAKDKRWCEACDKCAYMFTLLKAFKIDTEKLGFTHNLFDQTHAYLFDSFFSRDDESHFYGSQGELGLGFYLAEKNGCSGYSIERFKRELAPQFERELDSVKRQYLGIHPTNNIPKKMHAKIVSIYEEELKNL